MGDPEMAPADMALPLQRMSSGLSSGPSDYSKARLDSARKRRHRSAALKNFRALTQRDGPDEAESEGTLHEHSELEGYLMRELLAKAGEPSNGEPLDLLAAASQYSLAANGSFHLNTPKEVHAHDGDKAGGGQGGEQEGKHGKEGKEGKEGKGDGEEGTGKEGREEGKKPDAVDMMDPYEQMAELVFMLEEREQDLATAAQIGCELVSANETHKKRIAVLETTVEALQQQQSTDKNTIYVLQSRTQELLADKQGLEERVQELEERSAQQLITRMAQQPSGNQPNHKLPANEPPSAGNSRQPRQAHQFARRRRQNSQPQLFQADEVSGLMEDLDRKKADLAAAKQSTEELKEELLLVGEERRDLMENCERLERQQRQKDTRIRELMLDLKKARATIQSFEEMMERDRVYSLAASRQAEVAAQQRAQQDRDDEADMSARPSRHVGFDDDDEHLPPVEEMPDLGFEAPDREEVSQPIVREMDLGSNFLGPNDADGLGLQAQESVPSPLPPRRSSSVVEVPEDIAGTDVPVSAEGMEAIRKVLVLVDDKLAKRDALRWWMLYVLREQLRESKASQKGKSTARTHRFMGARSNRVTDPQTALQSRPKSFRKLKRPPQLNLARRPSVDDNNANANANNHSGELNPSFSGGSLQKQAQQDNAVGGWWKSLTSIIGDAGEGGGKSQPLNPKSGDAFAKPKDRKPKVGPLGLGARGGSSEVDEESDSNTNKRNNSNEGPLQRKGNHARNKAGAVANEDGEDEDDDDDDDEDEVVAARQRAKREAKLKEEREVRALERPISQRVAAPLIARGMQRDSFRESENDGAEFIKQAQSRGKKSITALHLRGVVPAIGADAPDQGPTPAAFQLVGNGDVVDGEGERQRDFFFFVHSSVLKRNPNLIVGAGEGNDAASLWLRAREEQVPYEQWDSYIRNELTRAMLRRKYTGVGAGLPAEERAGSVEEKVKARLRQRMERGDHRAAREAAGEEGEGTDAGQFLAMFRRPVNGTFGAFSSMLDAFGSAQ